MRNTISNTCEHKTCPVFQCLYIFKFAKTSTSRSVLVHRHLWSFQLCLRSVRTTDRSDSKKAGKVENTLKMVKFEPAHTPQKRPLCLVLILPFVIAFIPIRCITLNRHFFTTGQSNLSFPQTEAVLQERLPNRIVRIILLHVHREAQHYHIEHLVEWQSKLAMQ